MKTKKGHDIVFIKILHHSLLGNLFSGSCFNADTGDVVRAVFLTKEMRDKGVATGAEDCGPGYIILRDRGFVSESLVTTNISDNDWKKNIRKEEKKLRKDIEKKRELNKALDWRTRRLVALRLQRKALKQQ